jgi:hypothetical protein
MLVRCQLLLPYVFTDLEPLFGARPQHNCACLERDLPASTSLPWPAATTAKASLVVGIATVQGWGNSNRRNGS